MELMNLDSLTQMDSVKDFLGDIGKLGIFQSDPLTLNLNWTGLSSSTLLTSMSKVSDGGSNWLGDLASALVPQPDKSKDGDCMGLSAVGLMGLSCDMVSNFVCQAPQPKLLGENGLELPFSADLLKMADSLGIEYKLDLILRGRF